MAILRFIAEGVGPFQSVDIDFSDGNGNPHLGPHIVAGVNGAGKSTLLQAIASVLSHGAESHGFDRAEFTHLVAGHHRSRVCLFSRPLCGKPMERVASKGTDDKDELVRWLLELSADRKDAGELDVWYWDPWGAWNRTKSGPLTGAIPSARGKRDALPDAAWNLIVSRGSQDAGLPKRLFNYAAYRPARELRALANPDMNRVLLNPFEGALAFEGAVRNDVIQAWLLRLYSGKAIAAQRGEPTTPYAAVLARFEQVLSDICLQSVRFEVKTGKTLQPVIRLGGRDLNFSQLPDGVKSIAGWIADFMMRQELVEWDSSVGVRRPGVLLLDEADVHLHPQWQRHLLPAMRRALPDVQIIATSHSPFVISSCPGARVHLLDLDDQGRARLSRSIDAPIGQSILSTIKGIFGIESRFDVTTEHELDEWFQLKRSGENPTRMKELTQILGSRSEELRAIVGGPEKIPAAVIESLLSGQERKPARKGAGIK